MYHVSAQGVDERMINVYYYYYYDYVSINESTVYKENAIFHCFVVVAVLTPFLYTM